MLELSVWKLVTGAPRMGILVITCGRTGNLGIAQRRPGILIIIERGPAQDVGR
jgi:hypothetical protein